MFSRVRKDISGMKSFKNQNNRTILSLDERDIAKVSNKGNSRILSTSLSILNPFMTEAVIM